MKRMVTIHSTVLSIDKIITDAYLLWLDAPEIAGVAKPGQFLMVKCGDSTILRRPFAIHQVSRSQGRVALLFSVVGKGTGWLSSKKTGEIINILGPAGNNFEFSPGSKNILLVTGGLGIAPMNFLAQTAIDLDKSVILLRGAASSDCLYSETFLPTGVSCYTATEDGSWGSHCLITEMLHEFIGWSDQIIACGPEGMYHPIALQNRQLFKVRPYQVSLEVRMGCGFGACYGCSVSTRQGMKRVCYDGPVFNYTDIIWHKC